LDPRGRLKNVLENKGTSISVSSVHRTIKQADLTSRVRINKPFINEANRLKRVKFSKKYLKLGATKIGNDLFFYDECRIECFCSRRRVWIGKGEQPTPQRKLAHLPSIMIAGAINRAGKTKLIRIEGNLNAEGCVRMLNNHIIPDCKKISRSPSWKFLQDGAPCHSARKRPSHS